MAIQIHPEVQKKFAGALMEFVEHIEEVTRAQTIADMHQ